MSSAISIVKPGSSGSKGTVPSRSKLTAVHATPFVPNQSRTNSPLQPPPPPPPNPPLASQELEYDYTEVGYGHQLMNGPSYYHQSVPITKLIQPLDHHLYQHHQPTLPTNQPTFFLAPNLHQNLTSQIDAIEQTNPVHHPNPNTQTPNSVANYSGLVKLDKDNHTTTDPSTSTSNSSSSSMGGYQSVLYKGWNQGGQCVALRRLVNFRVQHEKQIQTVDQWTRIKHPGLVHFHEAFTTREFGDYSVVFVYDFHPLAVTLYDAHLSPLASLPPNPWSTNQPINGQGSTNQFRARSNNQPTGQQQQPNGGGLLERVLWSYIVQLSSVIKTIHHSGLAVRNLEPSRVIISSKNRIRLAGCGILDVILYEPVVGVHHQQDDLLALGKLIIALGCGSTSSVHNLPKSVDHISRVYSPELKNVVLYLLSKPGPRKSIDEVIALAGARVLDELNSSLVAEDKLERELLREVENGRLVRLLTKFGFINERPEFDHDPRWAETGDRYIIKLFRDYVFHQVDEAGRPMTDLSHVITALNKLDAGADEKLMLVSRDEQSVIIVSYKEVKNCIEAAFGDLSR